MGTLFSVSVEWMNSFYQCERKQHEENFKRLESSSFWCFAAFSWKPLPDGSLGADWTRLQTELEIEPMFADAPKREGCGIAWKLKLLCWANEDCCKLVPSTETKSNAFGFKTGREACCCKMSDIFHWCVMEVDLYAYELKLCRFSMPA